MRGIVFQIWDAFARERLRVAQTTSVNGTHDRTYLFNGVYSDDLLIAEITRVQQAVKMPLDTILYDFGVYFADNPVVERVCAHVVHGHLNTMRFMLAMDGAHAAMAATAASPTPPRFRYEFLSDRSLILIYDSARHMCVLLRGIIVGAARRYGDQAVITEQACMLHGAPSCRLHIQFSIPINMEAPGAAYNALNPRQMQEDTQILVALPEIAESQLAGSARGQIIAQKAPTIFDIVARLRGGSSKLTRLAPLYAALQRLENAGYVSSMDPEHGVDLQASLQRRRFWRTPAGTQRIS
jgi:hypothetical protein